MGRERMFDEIAQPVSDLVTRLGRLMGGGELDIRQRLVQAVHLRVIQLETPERAAEAARAVLWALYPYEDPDKEFWASEVGQACAWAIGHHRTYCSLQQAAWILNVSRQRVAQLATEERLLINDETGRVSAISLRRELRTHGRRRPRQ